MKDTYRVKGVFIKATEGVGYTDPEFKANVQGAVATETDEVGDAVQLKLESNKIYRVLPDKAGSEQIIQIHTKYVII